jgi:hypothetical protein
MHDMHIYTHDQWTVGGNAKINLNARYLILTEPVELVEC